MIIPVVEQGIERFLRARLPLDPTVGDVSFDPPSGSWSAQLSRLTVDLYLFAVSRSPQEARAVADRVAPSGRRERRAPSPIIELAYLVSTFAGSVRDEHALLSDVFTCFAMTPVLPAEHLPSPVSGPVQLALASTDGRAKDIWTGVGGSMHASFGLVVTAPVEGLAWEELPPAVERIEAMARAMPGVMAGAARASHPVNGR